MPPDGRRVLVLSHFFTQGHGGTPESVLLLARELAAYGIPVDVFSKLGLLCDAHLCDVLPAEAETKGFSRKVPDPKFYAAVYVTGSWNWRAPIIVLRAAIRGVPITYAAKGCLCWAEFTSLRDIRRVPYFLLIEWLLLAIARRIVFSSRAEQEGSIVPRWFWKRRAVRLPEPFRGDALAGPAKPATGVLTLGFLAEISARKGLYELIEGAGHYLASRRGAKLSLKIAGEVRLGSQAYLEECQALAARNGIAACIEWCGPVRGGQRGDFYRSLDIFMCPSRFESFGLTPLEALWQGIAICVSPAIGMLESLCPEAPALRLPSLSKGDVASAIAEAADDIEGWRRRAHVWAGRHALTRTNAEIASDFVHVLLDTERT